MKFFWFIGLLFIFSSCIKNNPTPSWISIEKWQLEANILLSGAEGELTHNFTDAFVYVDDKLIGVFELPIKIPVLITGENKKIMVYPAVRNNGIAATKKLYPFCEPHIIYSNLIAGETVTINPKTRYYSVCDFAWTEDFESAGIKITTDMTTSNATIEQVMHTDPGKTGNCGHIALTLSDSLWTGYSNDQLQLPIGGAEVYLEIDYKNSNNLLTGVLGISAGSTKINPNIQLNQQNPSNWEWKKIYIDLKEIVSSSSTAEYFEIYLQALIDAAEAEGDIYIDNVKVIHF